MIQQPVKIKLLILISFCLIMQVFANGQNTFKFNFNTLTVNDGLSEISINAMIQDSKGFLWLGTKDGLNRFDGDSFKVFRKSAQDTSSLGNNFIKSLQQINDSILYVGTDLGIYVMNTNSESFQLLDVKQKNGKIVESAINSMLLDEETLWVATSEQGLLTYNLKTLESKQLLDSSLNHPVWSIYKSKSGTIWVGTRFGLLRYDEKTKSLFPVKKLYSDSGNPNPEILSISEDVGGYLWLGTWSNGLLIYDEHDDEIQTFFDTGDNYVTHIRAIEPFDDRWMFVGSDDGLYLLNIKSKESSRVDKPHISHSLSDQNVYCILRDSEDGIWVGTYFGGLNYLNTSLLSMETYYPELIAGALSGKAVSQFCEDDKGNLWIATEDGGVNYFDTKTKLLTQPIKTSYHNTHALLLQGDELWIGTMSRGLDIYNLKNHSLRNYRTPVLNDDVIFSLYQTKDQDIYIGTPVGLNKYSKTSKTFSSIDSINAFVYDIKEDDFGNIWLATYGTGVMKYDPKLKEWISYDKLEGHEAIRGSKLNGIYIDKNKRLMFSSVGRGFFVYDYETDSFQNITESDGLPNNDVYGMLEDDFGNLWVSSNKGLAMLEHNNWKNITAYNKEDGLQSNQFNFKSSYKAKNGKFYFGGVNGFNSFYPKDIIEKQNKQNPAMKIISIQLLNRTKRIQDEQLQKTVNRSEKIVLPHDLASFTIRYRSLSYLNENSIQYAYKLKGIEDEWISVGNNSSVTYIDLSPGKYTFQVRASSNGDWSEIGDQIEIEILPPFWLTTTAKVIYLLIVVGIIYVLVSILIKRNRRKQQRLLDIYKTEQVTMAFKSKIDFFTTIAHEIRTPLSLIKAPLEDVIISNKGNTESQKDLLLIEKNCDRLTDLVDQLLDFRKMDTTQYVINTEKIALVELLREQFDRFRKMAQNKSINLELFTPDEEWFVISDRDALIKITSNLLTNAIKYTTNYVALSVKKSKNSYTIEVTDNGRGISDKNKELVFDPFYQVQVVDRNKGTGIGLSLVKHLVDVLNGKIVVEDNVNGGSVFSFSFMDIELTEEKEVLTDELDILTEPDDNHVITIRILVVDDNDSITSFLKDALQKEYFVDVAGDVAEAYSLLNGRFNYDLIVSDVMMPNIDGITFVKQLKSDLDFSHIPVILLSAKTENYTKVDALMSGADVFIEKPFSLIYLKAQIISLLDNRRLVFDTYNKSPLASYSTLVTNKKDEIFIDNLNLEIEKHIAEDNFRVEMLCDILNISRSNLQRKLKGVCGLSPGDYLRNYRLKKAAILLLQEDMRINEVAFAVGFNSASYFTKVFLKVYDMTPKEFINKQRNMDD